MDTNERVISPFKVIAQGTEFTKLTYCSGDCAWHIEGYGCAIKAIGELAAKNLEKI
jgi:hypothetical protein